MTKFWHWLADTHDWKEGHSRYFPPTGRFRARNLNMEEMLQYTHGFTRTYYTCKCGAHKYEDRLGKDG